MKLNLTHSFRWIMTGGLLAVLAACAPTAPRQEAPATPSQGLVYPAPPDEARFYYERMVMSSADVEVVDEDARLKSLLTGSAVLTATPLGKPYAVAARRGRIYVTDATERGVKVFDFPGRRYFTFRDTPEGGLGKPMGIDVDSSGQVYVADATRKAIYVFDGDGNFKRKIGDAKTFDRLTSVAVDPAGSRIYAVDIGGVRSERHRVLVFDGASGEFLFDIGKRGTDLGNFNLPRDLAVGKDGNLYIVDGGNFRVQVFDPKGNYLNSWGKVGKQLGDFARPKEVATDAEGNVYVVDAAFGNFQIFSPEGELLMFIGDRAEANGPGRYMLPSGIFVDEDGRVYVVDQWFRKIDIYRPAKLKEGEGQLVLGDPKQAKGAPK